MKIQHFEEAIINGHELIFDEALELINTVPLSELCKAADRVREHFCGNTIDLCSIINARSGKCTEDCKWCSQSRHFSTGITEYETIDKAEAVRQAMENRCEGVNRFSLVTSGRTVTHKQLDGYIGIYNEIADKSDISLCASMGLLTREKLQRLKDAGVVHYHCNIETAPSFFANLCSTHTMDEKVNTIRMAQEIGMKVCSGGIIGMGETMEQRVEMALFLREIGAVSIPINILMPVKGTPLQHSTPLTDDEILATFAIFRLINPKANIRFAGGRGQIIHRQHEALHAGINAALVGNYLTTIGAASVDEDKKNFSAAGFKINP